MSDVTIAPASADDIRSVLSRRGFDDLGMRLAMESAESGTAWVALDQAEAIGVAIAHDTSDERYVGEWFVEPSYRDQGLGGRLLDAAFEGAGDLAKAVRIDGSDRAALALTLRRGLAPRETVLRLAGPIPREEGLLRMAAGDYRFEVGAIDPAAHAFALDALDRETRGTTRPADHARFAVASTGQTFFYNGEFVAYAYVWPDGRIGPLATMSTAYIVQVFAFALVTLQRTYGASWCTTLLPGTNLRLGRAALRAGLRVKEHFVVASEALPIDVSRFAAFHPQIF